MRIALLASNAVTYWLAGQPGVSERVHSSSAGLHITAKIQVQEDNLVRSPNAIPYDRQNLLTTISFGTTLQFDTTDEAEAFALDYDQNTPRTGTLILQTEIPGGSTVAQRYMPGAVVHPPNRAVTGTSVTIQYTVVGGAIIPGTGSTWDNITIPWNTWTEPWGT